MDLLVKTLVQEAMELGSKGVRLRAIGDVSSLPQACQAELDRVKDGPDGEVHLDLVLALSYSAKWEMVEAIRAMMKEGLRRRRCCRPPSTSICRRPTCPIQSS